MAATRAKEESGFPDFSQLTGDLYRAWERSMTSWWEQVVDSPGVLGAMGQHVARMAEARAQYEDAVDQGLERMRLPSHKDLVRLARICTLLEEKLLRQEDLVLGLEDRLARMERELVQARIEAAEARLEAREQLAALSARLEAPSPRRNKPAGKG